jgi:hypothetical protein
VHSGYEETISDWTFEDGKLHIDASADRSGLLGYLVISRRIDETRWTMDCMGMQLQRVITVAARTDNEPDLEVQSTAFPIVLCAITALRRITRSFTCEQPNFQFQTESLLQ